MVRSAHQKHLLLLHLPTLQLQELVVTTTAAHQVAVLVALECLQTRTSTEFNNPVTTTANMPRAQDRTADSLLRWLQDVDAHMPPGQDHTADRTANSANATANRQVFDEDTPFDQDGTASNANARAILEFDENPSSAQYLDADFANAMAILRSFDGETPSAADTANADAILQFFDEETTSAADIANADAILQLFEDYTPPAQDPRAIRAAGWVSVSPTQEDANAIRAASWVATQQAVDANIEAAENSAR